MQRFVYTGKVRGQGRPRFTKRGFAYKDKNDKEYEKAILNAYKKSGIEVPRFNPIAVTIDVYRALPKSTPKRIESQPDIMKPDVDNIAKSVLDALNGHAFDDDAQVVSLNVVKHERKRQDEDFMVIGIDVL